MGHSGNYVWHFYLSIASSCVLKDKDKEKIKAIMQLRNNEKKSQPVFCQPSSNCFIPSTPCQGPTILVTVAIIELLEN